VSIPVKALTAERVYRRCDPGKLGFTTTAEIQAPRTAIGQDRALEAIEFGTEMEHFGYNLFVFGAGGSGKHGIVLDHIRATAAGRTAPDDWCYVNNFVTSHKPSAMRLPTGRARPFANDMELFIENLKASLPAAFESDEYRERRQALEAVYQQKHEEALTDLQKEAEHVGAAIVRTPVGFGVAPVENGQVVSPEVFQKWPAERQQNMRENIAKIETELARIAQNFPIWQRELFEELRRMNREVTESAVSHLFAQLAVKYGDLDNVGAWLQDAKADLVEHAEALLLSENPAAQGEGESPSQIDGFNRYVVNVIVDNAETGQAPVIYEDHPTHPNLFGRIEHQARMGALFTDFKLIKPGAVHLANGGYLVLDAAKVVSQPMIWEELKRIMRSRRLRIEGIYESLGLSSTVTLEPEEIPIDVKIVLIGDRRLHYLMSAYDPDVMDLFKVPVDFEDSMQRTQRSERQYASLIAGIARGLELRPLNAMAVARVIEQGSRLSGDAARLTLQLRLVQDLLREADHYAAKAGAGKIGAAHVEEAVRMHIRRRDRVRERSYEQINRGTIMVDTKGAVTGQVNGLSVLQMGDFAFGQPSRITARVRMGRGEIIDIERQVEMGGPLHSKGVLILSGYLGGKFARERPLALSASLVFEQSYGGVDGDSASSAELYSLLSALADVPIKQCFAVTGSVNQKGEVQAIGGVNEKIEGFFDVCSARGLTGDQGVLIPASNVLHLMLRSDVGEAIGKGTFSVYPIKSIDQGIELLTGVPAGRARKNGSYDASTVNGKVTAQLSAFIEAAKALSGSANERSVS
jgi:lon-related putative ATP-dependent protease